jgi:hypothetical protein
MEEREDPNLLPSSRKASQEPDLHDIEFVRTSDRKIRRHSSEETVPHSLHKVTHSFARFNKYSLAFRIAEMAFH